MVTNELETLRVEVERLRRQEGGQTRAAQSAWRNADRLRAELADERAKVARVEALLPPDLELIEARYWVLASDLRAALDGTSEEEK